MAQPWMLMLTICLLFTPVCSFDKPFGDPIPAIQGLVSRILGASRVPEFDYEIIATEEGKDVFEVDADKEDGRPVLRGNNGVSLASALNFYLKYYCNCSISWGRNGTGDQLRLPQPLPLPESKVRVVSPLKYRYYQNVCTVSYSMVWWNYTRWQREIDWMAMNGLNLILSFTGQEYIWRKFYTSLGLTDAEIDAFFSGAAFLAWQRMGNLRRWGGPLDDVWMTLQAEMQIKILLSVRQFGMISVLPGFAGHVPAALKRIFPNANFTQNRGWNNFNATYSDDYLLEPTDPLFIQLGEKYYSMLTEEFGTDHVFNADTYNEMDPSSTNLTFLADTNKAIYQAMANVDKDAVFLMQGWLFHSGFWSSSRIKAFLSGVPDDKMIILDLNSEQSPIWTSTESYFGKPFIWCLLHNYGGTRGIYGNLSRIATGPVEALHTPGSTMVGVGMTPEAIEHNPIVYDLMGEMSWRSEVVQDLEDWVQKYIARRYGKWDYSEDVRQAWAFYLLYGAYQYHWSWDIKSIVDRAPALVMATDYRFDATLIAAAWQMLVEAAASEELDPSVGPLQYDIVDIGRQVLVNLFVDMHTMYSLAYDKFASRGVNSTSELTGLSAAMLNLLTDLDSLLGSNTNFLLGHWIVDARNSAASTSPKNVSDNLEFNARNQITMWGPHQNIEDYASKEWSGVVEDYYKNRWMLFTSMVNEAVHSGNAFNQSEYNDARFQLEQKWSYEIKSYPTEPTGNVVFIASTIVAKYYYSTDEISKRYKKVTDMDIIGHDVYGLDKKGPWTHLLGTVAMLCDINDSCLGFNSYGLLKNSTDNMQLSTGIVLYLKHT